MASRADSLIPDGRETLAGAASPASRAAAMAIGAFAVAWMLGSASAAPAPAIPGALSFTEKHCASCHNDVDKEGGFDIASLKFAPDAPGNAQRWVLVHDRVKAGEMPPKEKQRPDGGDRSDRTGADRHPAAGANHPAAA
jgi:hypothetical protein